MKVLSLVAAATVVAITLHATGLRAQSVTVADTGGRCDKLSFAGDPLTCTGLIFTVFTKTRRATFTLASSNGGLTLAGGKDIQPDPEHYQLLIDHLIYRRAGGSADQITAKGKCETISDEAFSELHSLSCDVSTKFGPIIVRFSGRGKLTVKQFP